MNEELAHLIEKFELTSYGKNVRTDCRYEVLIYEVRGRRGFEATAVFDKYPNYTDMLELFQRHNIRAVDFLDENSCMKDKLVYGIAMKNGKSVAHPVARYVIERIEGTGTKLEELFR